MSNLLDLEEYRKKIEKEELRRILERSNDGAPRKIDLNVKLTPIYGDQDDRIGITTRTMESNTGEKDENESG